MSSAETQGTGLSSADHSSTHHGPTYHDDAAGSADSADAAGPAAGSLGACDPADLAPICDEQEFTEILESIVADYAPGVFAVAQVYGDRSDGRVVAWGITFDDRVEVISVNGRRRMSLSAPEEALRVYSTHEHTTAHLVWVTPRATPSDDEDS